MSSASLDKGKSRAIDPQVVSDSLLSTTNHVQPKPIPPTTLLNVEYPGLLTADAGQPSSSSYNSLERALSTLHPSALPPLTSSPHEGLNFLSRIPNQGLKVVECRLGGFASPHLSKRARSDDDIDQVYKAPLLGEAIPTHNIVIRLVKRTWRQKKRRHPSSASPGPQVGLSAPPNDMALDPALFEEETTVATGLPDEHAESRKRSRYTGRLKKEYCVEIIGLATNTVRFRSMADFAFQPDVRSTASPDQTVSLDPVMALHKALATMDLEAFQSFRVPPQLEDYQIQTPSGIKSNLHMVPPSFFSRMDVPFNYNFQQTPYSELRTVPIPPHLTKPSGSQTFAHILKRDVNTDQMQRFVNRVRLSNVTPQPFRVGRDQVVPTMPLPDVVRIQHRCEPKVLVRLKELLEERPIWSRVALKNQLTETELRELNGNNEKVYYALVGYSMVGGPWRDTIVRFGYDVRTDVGSRVYQRIFLRGGPGLREPRLAGQGSSSKPVTNDGVGDEEEEEDESLASVARSSVVRLPTTVAARATNTHLFDGTTLHRNVGNFQLCDIKDPLITPYIWRHSDDETRPHSTPEQFGAGKMGIEWLRTSWDAESGWYTRRALELIRALVTARFKAVADTATPLDVDAVQAIVTRVRHKWREEDAGLRGPSVMDVREHADETEAPQ